MARSIAGIRSNFHSLCCSMRPSSSLTCFVALSNNSFAKLSVRSAAAAPFQNCSTSLRGSFLLISRWKSICMAYSRDLERRRTLLATHFRVGGLGRCRGFQLAGKLRHFDCGKPCFKSLVAAFQAGTVNCLLEGVTGQHTENHWDTGIHLRELQATRRFGTNVVVVRSFAAKHAADCDQRIILAGERELLGG